MSKAKTKTETKPIWQTKTFWACASAALAAAAGYATGEITAAQALQTGLTAVVGLTLRHNLPKTVGGE